MKWLITILLCSLTTFANAANTNFTCKIYGLNGNFLFEKDIMAETAFEATEIIQKTYSRQDIFVICHKKEESTI